MTYKQRPEYIYAKEDIDKAFDMGVYAVVSAFEKTIGMSQKNQRVILQRIKDTLIENRAIASKPQLNQG